MKIQKKTIAFVTIGLMVITAGGALAAPNFNRNPFNGVNTTPQTAWVDADGDGVCDNQGSGNG
ncbi:MAG: hypothetical protein RSG58_09265, partial [Eubacterium sp.]